MVGLLPFDKKNTMGKTFCSAGVCVYDGITVESPDSHVVEEKVGVLLLNLGGPETLNDVQPFLFNLFADPVCWPYCINDDRLIFCLCLACVVIDMI